MERNEQMRIASALAEISMQVTRKCKEDYLYELVAIVEALDNKRNYVLFARETGADGMNRFTESVDIIEGIQAAKKSLGVDCVFTFVWNEKKGNWRIEVLNINLDKSTIWALTNGFDSRCILYRVVD